MADRFLAWEIPVKVVQCGFCESLQGAVDKREAVEGFCLWRYALFLSIVKESASLALHLKSVDLKVFRS